MQAFFAKKDRKFVLLAVLYGATLIFSVVALATIIIPGVVSSATDWKEVHCVLNATLFTRPKLSNCLKLRATIRYQEGPPWETGTDLGFGIAHDVCYDISCSVCWEAERQIEWESNHPVGAPIEPCYRNTKEGSQFKLNRDVKGVHWGWYIGVALGIFWPCILCIVVFLDS